MRQLFLHEVHKEMGAQFGNCENWEIPINYGNSSLEYNAVRNSVGISDLSNRGKLELKGKEHIKFLQGMLTNEIMGLDVYEGTYATLLTIKGRVVSDMVVYKDKESVILDLEPEMEIKVREMLTKYRLSYKADIEDITHSFVMLSLNGPNSEDLLKTLGLNIGGLKLYGFVKSEIDGFEFYVMRVNRTGETGFDVMIQNEFSHRFFNRAIDAGRDFAMMAVGFDALEILRIEAGIPKFKVDFNESNIPIEAGLWNALSFEKGCYIGQEVIARIKWRGHVNWHLKGFLVSDDHVPDKDTELYVNGKKIGRVTSGVYSPAINMPIAIGYIRREFSEPDTEVYFLADNDEQVSAKVVELPFIQ